MRVDAKDRVWFTLALSTRSPCSTVPANSSPPYDLPFRSLMERITVKLTPTLMGLTRFGIPVANLVKVDHQSTGVPLPTGLDITPDGRVWFARLYTNEIGVIDPDTAKLGDHDSHAFKAPGACVPMPRETCGSRLQRIADRALQPEQGRVHHLRPARGAQGQRHALRAQRGPQPQPGLGQRHQSDTVYRLDVASGQWDVYPMPRKVTFTRDVEIDRDGRAGVTGAAFPSWHIGAPAHADGNHAVTRSWCLLACWPSRPEPRNYTVIHWRRRRSVQTGCRAWVLAWPLAATSCLAGLRGVVCDRVPPHRVIHAAEPVPAGAWAAWRGRTSGAAERRPRGLGADVVAFCGGHGGVSQAGSGAACHAVAAGQRPGRASRAATARVQSAGTGGFWPGPRCWAQRGQAGWGAQLAAGLANGGFVHMAPFTVVAGLRHAARVRPRPAARDSGRGRYVLLSAAVMGYRWTPVGGSALWRPVTGPAAARALLRPCWPGRPRAGLGNCNAVPIWGCWRCH